MRPHLLFDILMGLALRLTARRRKAPSGVLLVTVRGPAEMVFLSAVVTRFMRLAERHETVTLLLRRDAAGMAFLFPRRLQLKRIDYSRLTEPGTRWAAFREMHRANFRLVVSLDDRRVADQDEALVAATRAPRRAAMDIGGDGRPRRRGAFTTLFPAGDAHQDKILRWSRFADFLGGFRQPAALARLPDARLPAPMRLPPTAVLMPFSAVMERQLPPHLWLEVMDALPPGWQVRVAAHQSDFDRNPQFMSIVGSERVIVDTSDFEKLAAVLMGSRIAVGVDTAGMHLAILLGVPTVCVASAAYVGAGVPYDDKVIPATAHFLYTPMPCQGCLGHCPFPQERGMLPCVAAVAASRVAAAVGDILVRGGA